MSYRYLTDNIPISSDRVQALHTVHAMPIRITIRPEDIKKNQRNADRIIPLSVKVKDGLDRLDVDQLRSLLRGYEIGIRTAEVYAQAIRDEIKARNVPRRNK